MSGLLNKQTVSKIISQMNKAKNMGLENKQDYNCNFSVKLNHKRIKYENRESSTDLKIHIPAFGSENSPSKFNVFVNACIKST